MTKEHEELLKRMAENIEDFLRKSTPISYWKKEEEILMKLKKENDEIEKSIQMTPEKFREPFTI